MFRRIREFFWPILESFSEDDERIIAEEGRRNVAQIENLAFHSEIDTALNFAKAIYDEEADRSKSSDNKAFQYLLVAAAIVSLLTYLETAVWDGKVGTAPRWVSLPILMAAVAYLVRAALWALKAVSTRTYHVVGVADIVDIWSRRAPKAKLAKEILIACLKNQDEINLKVSCVTMATAFLSRTIISFGLLLVVEIGWELSTWALPWLMTHTKLVSQAANLLVHRLISP